MHVLLNQMTEMSFLNVCRLKFTYQVPIFQSLDSNGQIILDFRVLSFMKESICYCYLQLSPNYHIKVFCQLQGFCET